MGSDQNESKDSPKIKKQNHKKMRTIANKTARTIPHSAKYIQFPESI